MNSSTHGNTQIVLKRHPEGAVSPDDFELVATGMPEIADGQVLIRNLYLSMDAGFRHWMTEGAGDNYLPGMQLGDPVQSMVLGQVVKSRHSDYVEGAYLSARCAWECFSVLDGSDLAAVIEPEPGVPLHEYMSLLGPTGMTAYFGLMQLGRPAAQETLLVSAAGGAVGTAVGQLGKIHGCRTVGLTGTEAKAEWLRQEVGYDVAISREADPDLAAALSRDVPDGIDVFFDNVGGATLDTALGQLSERARIVLCGAMSQYEQERPEPVFNTWELITKRARMEGFMFSDYADQFGAAAATLAGYYRSGALVSFNQVYAGIESAPQAFCDMMHGASRGKCLVDLSEA